MLINYSRGDVVDLDAVRKAIETGKLGGAAVDVFPVEPEKNGDNFSSILQNLAERHPDAAYRRLNRRRLRRTSVST